jgi:hypothetical protein
MMTKLSIKQLEEIGIHPSTSHKNRFYVEIADGYISTDRSILSVIEEVYSLGFNNGVASGEQKKISEIKRVLNIQDSI